MDGADAVVALASELGILIGELLEASRNTRRWLFEGELSSSASSLFGNIFM